MANVQRGKVTRIYDIQNTAFMWEESDRDQEAGLRGGVLDEDKSIRRHARNIPPFMDLLVKDLQEEYALSLRGARAQRLNDLRAAMTTWALARVEKDTPSLSTATAGMLLKAESRTVTAVLNARTSKQVVEAMQAAIRRAGIPASQMSQPAPAASNVPPPPPPSAAGGRNPQHTATASSAQQTTSAMDPRGAQQQSPLGHDIEELKAMLVNQAHLTNLLLESTSQAMTSPQTMQLVQGIHAYMVQQQNAMLAMTDRVEKLEGRFKDWETTYLQEILARLPHGLPPTVDRDMLSLTPIPPPAAATTPVQEEEPSQTTVPYRDDDDMMCGQIITDEVDKKKEEQQIVRDKSARSSSAEPPNNLIQNLEQRSLRSQSLKVVNRAKRPFGSSKH